MPLATKKNYKKRKSALSVRQKQAVSGLVKKNFNRMVETKYVSVAVQVQNVPASGYWSASLTQMNRGNDDKQARIGDEILLRHMTLRYALQSADSTNFVRVAVIQWLDDDVTSPGLADILENPTTIPYISSFNHDNYQGGKSTRKFKVLYDRTHSFSNTGTQAAVAQVSINNFDKRIRFNGTSATGRGHIFLMAVSDSAASGHPLIQYDARITYKDA